jgi:hypothetical protein
MCCCNSCSRSASNNGPSSSNCTNSTGTGCTKPPCNRATIRRPLGSLDTNPNPVASWLTTPCFHFDFQGVVSGSAGPYVLSFQGEVDPGTTYSMRWTLEAACGTLAPDTSATPTHTAPAAPGEGLLRLTGMDGTTPASCTDQKRLKIYPDHLARDRDNFGVGISCSGSWTFTKYGTTITMASTWNCFGSSDHIYNGSGTGYTPSVGIASGWATTIYNAPISVSDWTAINASLLRGDVVSFWSDDGSGGFAAQHAHTCISGTTMYGANNEPVINPIGHPATWRWFETTSQTYYTNVNSNPRTRDFLTRVKVHRKP